MPHENRSRSEDHWSSVDQETRDILNEHTRLDQELYRYAVELMHTREKQQRHSPDGRAEVTEPNRFLPFPLAPEPRRRVTIRSVSAAWEANPGSRMLEIAVRFRADAIVPDLSIGVQVTDVAGRVVWGTSTANERLKFEYGAGRTHCLTFVVRCELPKGLYFVTAALAEPRRLGLHEHWIDNATLFTVTRERMASNRYVRGMLRQHHRCVPEG